MSQKFGFRGIRIEIKYRVGAYRSRLGFGLALCCQPKEFVFQNSAFFQPKKRDMDLTNDDLYCALTL